MTSVRKMTALTRAGITESLQFRLGTAVTLFANLIYLALVYYLWKAIYASSGTDVVNGMTFYDTMIYLILATAIFNFLEMFIVWDMSRAIQSGEIIMHLLKPMRYRKYIFWSYSGSLVMSFVQTFIPTFLVVAIITRGAIPMGWNLLSFAVSLLLALVVNYNIEMLVAPICLYTESTWGINIVKETIVLLLSGATIPLAFFPEGLRRVVDYLPFRAVYDIPLRVLLKKGGTDTWQGLLPALGLQLVWCIVLSILGNLFWNRAVKRITVNGG
ncbi:MAG: ABC-2 family transporter protein [Lachnospiraceae bacterium]|nr:ABC-2 family transporter protein [Lachnospiraceae bacterium]